MGSRGTQARRLGSSLWALGGQGSVEAHMFENVRPTYPPQRIGAHHGLPLPSAWTDPPDVALGAPLPPLSIPFFQSLELLPNHHTDDQ